MESQPDNVEFYFNTTTGMVEQGRQSAGQHLLGPFLTADAAARALDNAANRSDAWDDEDKAWRGED